MNQRRVPLDDADYLTRLSKEDKDWYRRFTAEHYYGRRPKNRNESILSQSEIRKAWREQHAQRRDAHWRASHEAVDISINTEDILIRIYDNKNLPLHHETILGVYMEDKKKQELEFALSMLEIALDSVGDSVGTVKENQKKIQCFNWLNLAKADIEKQLAA
jgi:hypothetical protein